MTALTTIAKVQKVITYDETVITDVQMFIDDAADLLDSILESGDLTDVIREKVERWLAAHFIAIVDPRLADEGVKSLRQSYQYKLGKGLELSHHGSMAMQMDTSGKLAAWNKGVVEGTAGTPSLTWLGTTYS